MFQMHPNVCMQILNHEHTGNVRTLIAIQQNKHLNNKVQCLQLIDADDVALVFRPTSFHFAAYGGSCCAHRTPLLRFRTRTHALVHCPKATATEHAVCTLDLVHNANLNNKKRINQSSS